MKVYAFHVINLFFNILLRKTEKLYIYKLLKRQTFFII